MPDDNIASVAKLAILSILIVSVVALPNGEKFLSLLRELLREVIKRFWKR